MNTIKIFLAESGRVANLKKDFPLYQGQFQNKLLNIYVPTSILAPQFKVENEDGTVTADYVASTSVKIGMTYTARNGSIRVSKNYYMRYLKKLTVQNVEYALYERKLPKEFTLYAGQGANAPVLIANVVNIEQVTESGTPTVLSVITTQTCALDVMPSTNLDNDEAVEPSELDNINAELNGINETLATKQDKIDEALDGDNKSVVGVINNINGRVATNTGNIEEHNQRITKNENEIKVLRENLTLGETYIGQIISDIFPPAEVDLTNYVTANTSPSRPPRNGDVIIYIWRIPDKTDRNYKFFYTAAKWKYYEIPAIQSALNGVLGLVQGTYAIESENKTLVDISGGEIKNIYVTDENGDIRNILEYLNTTTGNIAKIVDGTTSVGRALRAVADGVGNPIVETYLTKALGVTQQQLRDYAMPRLFNEVSYISAEGYVSEPPTTPESGIQFSVEFNGSLGTELFTIKKDLNAGFELSSKNGSNTTIHFTTTRVDDYSFTLETMAIKNSTDPVQTIRLNSEILYLTVTSANLSTVNKLTFSNPFMSLGNNVINLEEGDQIQQTLYVMGTTGGERTVNIYSNDLYPSMFSMTTQTYTSSTSTATGKTIELGVIGFVTENYTGFDIDNESSYLDYFTNNQEFVISGHIPLDRILPPIDRDISQTLFQVIKQDRAYGLYNQFSGARLKMGDLATVTQFDPVTGYFITFKAIWKENSDYVGFALVPPVVEAQQLDTLIQDSDTIVTDLTADNQKVSIHLSADVVNKLGKVLVSPVDPPAKPVVVGVNTNGAQTNLMLGDGLQATDTTIEVDQSSLDFISYAEEQTLTEEQKAQARSNIGAGSGSFSGSYNDLSAKPTLNTTNTASLEPSANETIQGVMNLHKVAKTGLSTDLADADELATKTEVEAAQATADAALPLTGGVMRGDIVFDTTNNQAWVGLYTNNTLNPTRPIYSNALIVKNNTGSQIIIGANDTQSSSSVKPTLVLEKTRMMAWYGSANVMDLGTPTLKFNNLYLKGQANVGGIVTQSPVTEVEQNYTLVTDLNGNVYKRAMNKVLDDIGGSTVLTDGVRQDTLETNNFATKAYVDDIVGTINARLATMVTV